MAFEPYKFDPFEETGIEVPKNKRAEALEVVASFLKEQMLLYIGEGVSPLSQGKWKRGLTKDYKEIKGQESSATFANLELSGEFLSSLIVEPEKNKIIIDVAEDQEGKAEAFLTGQYGKGKMEDDYRREFMPTDDNGKSFKRDILKNIKEILQEYEEE